MRNLFRFFLCLRTILSPRAPPSLQLYLPTILLTKPLPAPSYSKPTYRQPTTYNPPPCVEKILTTTYNYTYGPSSPIPTTTLPRPTTHSQPYWLYNPRYLHPPLQLTYDHTHDPHLRIQSYYKSPTELCRPAPRPDSLLHFIPTPCALATEGSSSTEPAGSQGVEGHPLLY